MSADPLSSASANVNAGANTNATIAQEDSFLGLDVTYIATILAGVLTLIAALYFTFSVSSSKRKHKTIAIVGPSGAGKTALFLKWTGHSSETETVISTAPNESEVTFPPDASSDQTNIRLIDLPGHDKLQHFTIEELQSKDHKMRAIVFVVDAAVGEPQLKNTASHLCRVLEISEPRGIPVLIAVNKIDLFSSLSPSKITGLLEANIAEIRESKTKNLTDSGANDDDNPIWLGADTSEFHFEDLETEVSVVEGSVKQGRTAKWEDWLSSH